MEELKEAVRDAVRCHFAEVDLPRVIRLHLVKEAVAQETEYGESVSSSRAIQDTPCHARNTISPPRYQNRIGSLCCAPHGTVLCLDHLCSAAGRH